jgi:hypothetical protein
MATETHTTAACEALRRRLASGAYKSSVDVLLETIGRIIQRLTRRSNPPAPLLNALAIALSVALIGLLSSLLAGETMRAGYQTIVFGGVAILIFLAASKSAFDRVFTTLRDNILDALESDEGVAGLESWLVAAGDMKNPALVSLALCVLFIIYDLTLAEPIIPPIDVVVVGIFILLFSGFTVYYILLFMTLPSRLSGCQIKLHAEDPASTEVMEHWTGMMNHVTDMFAVMEGTATLFSITIVTFTLQDLLLIIPAWLPLIVFFVINLTAVSEVISRSKRKTLNEIEAQMNDLRPTGETPNYGALDTLIDLWDYHDRIKGTRDSLLDIGGIVKFVNTLLIPVLAFLIANREAILELLSGVQ